MAVADRREADPNDLIARLAENDWLGDDGKAFLGDCDAASESALEFEEFEGEPDDDYWLTMNARYGGRHDR